MTGDRLRELAQAAEANAEFYTPSGVLAQQELETLAPAMAVLLADAIDALDKAWRFERLYQELRGAVWTLPMQERLESVQSAFLDTDPRALLVRFRQLGDTA